MSVFDPERKTGLGSEDGRKTAEQEEPGDRAEAASMLSCLGLVLLLIAVAEILR